MNLLKLSTTLKINDDQIFYQSKSKKKSKLYNTHLAAWMPSHVDANLIKMRLRSMPNSSNIAINFNALSMLVLVSKDRRASTSIDTRPGTIFKISIPNNTDK